MITTGEKVVLATWASALLGTALAYWTLDLGGLVSVLLTPFPNLALYLTAFLALYLPLWLLAQPLAPRAGRIAAALAAATATLALAVAIPDMANRGSDAQLDQILRREKFAPVTLTPVRSIALVEVNAEYDPLVECGDFCISLLLSGTAKEVLVAGRRATADAPPADLPGIRYSLAPDQAHCVKPDTTWSQYFVGMPFEQAHMTGGYWESIRNRFGGCVISEPTHSERADIVFFYSSPTGYSSEPGFAGLDWDLRWIGVRFMQEVIDNRGAAPAVRVRRLDYFATTIDRPLNISLLGKSAQEHFVPAGWARTTLRPRDRDVFLDGWWPLIRNGGEIYAKATGGR
jgi:hypothetical protein